MNEEQADRIIELLEHLVIKSFEPQGPDISYWRCKCGMQNIKLASSPKSCVICEMLEPLRIEAAREYK